MRKDADHPKRVAIQGDREAVTAPPIWPPMFISPETVPDDGPAISAVTAQKELCDR